MIMINVDENLDAEVKINYLKKSGKNNNNNNNDNDNNVKISLCLVIVTNDLDCDPCQISKRFLPE